MNIRSTLRPLYSHPYIAKLLTLLLLTLLGVSCNDHAIVDPAARCQLTEIDGAFIDGLKSTFEYDANGRVSRMVRKFDNATYDYRFTYDTEGRLSRSVVDDLDSAGAKIATLNETYTWTNGRIARFNWEYTTGEKGVNNLTYNAAGQLIGFTTEYIPADPALDTKWAYTYDTNGVLVNRLITSLDGQTTLFEAKLSYTTNQIIKTAFSLLPQAGLPVDPVLARQWEANYPKNDGVLSYYLPDSTGKLELFAQGTLNNMIFNQSGIATGWSYGNVTGDLTPVSFRVTGCL
jgi:5-hydroxyisourate hydrolase-like protein (transthyretin family)